MSEWRTELHSLLAERSIRFGDFTLASGAKSNVYVDVRATSLSSDGSFWIGKAFLETIRSVAPNAVAVGGLTLGADPLVTATAIAAHLEGESLDAMIVRKETKAHGTQNMIEHPGRAQAGDEVVVVDDVITSGGSTLKAVDSLRAAGFVVSHAICVVDRQAGGREALAEHGIELRELFTIEDFAERD